MKIFNLSHMKMNIMYEWQIGISTLRLPYYTAHPNIVNVEVQKKKKSWHWFKTCSPKHVHRNKCGNVQIL